jgi:hypothetical protein
LLSAGDRLQFLSRHEAFVTEKTARIKTKGFPKAELPAQLIGCPAGRDQSGCYWTGGAVAFRTHGNAKHAREENNPLILIYLGQ